MRILPIVICGVLVSSAALATSSYYDCKFGKQRFLINQVAGEDGSVTYVYYNGTGQAYGPRYQTIDQDGGTEATLITDNSQFVFFDHKTGKLTILHQDGPKSTLTVLGQAPNSGDCE